MSACCRWSSPAFSAAKAAPRLFSTRACACSSVSGVRGGGLSKIRAVGTRSLAPAKVAQETDAAAPRLWHLTILNVLRASHTPWVHAGERVRHSARCGVQVNPLDLAKQQAPPCDGAPVSIGSVSPRGAVHLRELSFSARQWSPPRSWVSRRRRARCRSPASSKWSKRSATSRRRPAVAVGWLWGPSCCSGIRPPCPSQPRSNWDEPPPDWCSAQR